MKTCGDCKNKSGCRKFDICAIISNYAEECSKYDEALKKCPFCGGEGELSNIAVRTADGQKKWSVECLECGVILDRETKLDAFKAWNNRI